MKDPQGVGDGVSDMVCIVIKLGKRDVERQHWTILNFAIRRLIMSINCLNLQHSCGWPRWKAQIGSSQLRPAWSSERWLMQEAGAPLASPTEASRLFPLPAFSDQLFWTSNDTLQLKTNLERNNQTSWEVKRVPVPAAATTHWNYFQGKSYIWCLNLH